MSERGWPPELPPSFIHEWRVRVFEVSGKVAVEPGNGKSYMTIGVFGNPFPHWGPGEARYSSNPARLRRLIASCQRWCDKRNATEARAHDLAQRLLAEGQADAR